MSYVNAWRLRAAHIMLAEERDTMGKISFAVGCEFEEAFSRAFKTAYGLGPG